LLTLLRPQRFCCSSGGAPFSTLERIFYIPGSDTRYCSNPSSFHECDVGRRPQCIAAGQACAPA
jgi:hypothetical protein